MRNAGEEPAIVQDREEALNLLTSGTIGILSLHFLAALLLLALRQPCKEPPRLSKRPHVTRVHGRELIDDYFWIRDRSDPETIPHLQAENEYTASMTAHLEELRKTIYREMRERIQEDDVSAPVRLGDYFYYTRTEAGKQYAIHCRKHRSLDASEEILLDENQLAEGKPYFRLGVFEVSPDHRLLAYSTDEEGSERYTITLKELASGRLLDERIANTSPTLEWANDNRTFFYVTLDAAHRPHQALRHELGKPVEQDGVVFTETDESFFLGVEKTRSRRFLLLISESKTSSETRFLEADHPAGDFRVIQARKEKHEYAVDHRGELFYIVTNWKAADFRLMTAPVDDPGSDNWVEVIPARSGVRLQSVALFRDHLAIFERDQGIRRVRVADPGGGRIRDLKFAETVYTALPGPNPEFDTKVLRVHYSSLVTPPSVYDFDMETGAMELKKRIEVKGGYDPSNYLSERLEATARDGRKIPISIVRKANLDPKKSYPLYLYGYGAYGLSIDPIFNSNRLSLLDRDVVVAIAHVRGGEELGRDWYEQGKLQQKRNTFEDFVACGRHLIDLGRTTPEKLAICGGSAGGLLIGAVINERPDLFQAAVAHVPFVDLINTMLDPSLPLTITEYEEWGNPNVREDFEYMLSYSPYDQVAAKDYPALLVTAGLNDPRVAYWEPAKWVARLRELGIGNRPVLLFTNLGAGHGGASGRFDRLTEVAREYAFVLDHIGRDGGRV